ncbi:uncharacterized protein DEA37_0008336 [Paragonimus westermani]|uniref:Globin domain-containing protein n=1 Tax=Paragonimus westermani TaxID=34504 RepID=A0A5J4NY79_9TREM|nr:uncharacterized protein DEA37_0008336 [Paragonimus westermani]
MAVLTQGEVDSLVAELGPRLENLEEFGMSIYKELFTAHPEYITLFSKLQGLTLDNVMQSEGIKYYGRTLATELKLIVTNAANASELEAILVKNSKDHSTRNVTSDQFLSGEPVFVKYFNELLTKDENKAAMEKLLKHAMPAIASKI